jgi:hypothetical protein
MRRKIINVVSRISKPLQASRVGLTAEGAFKCEIQAFRRQTIDLRQHHSGSCDRSMLGCQWRQPGGDEIGIDEIQYASVIWQVLARESGFAAESSHNFALPTNPIVRSRCRNYSANLQMDPERLPPIQKLVSK